VGQPCWRFPQRCGCGARRGPGVGLRRCLEQGKERWSRAYSQQPSGVTCSEGNPTGAATLGACSSKGVIDEGEISGTKTGESGAKIRGKMEKKNTMEGRGDVWVAQCCRAMTKEEIPV